MKEKIEKNLKILGWLLLYFLQLGVSAIFNRIYHTTNDVSDYVFAMFLAYLIVYTN